MSIHFITGVPRSGKTYRSTYKIWRMYTLVELNKFKALPSFMHWFFFYFYKFFPPARKEVFKNTYTNINQFDFSYNKQIKKLVYSDLYTKLHQLYALYMAGSDDDELKLKSKELDIYDSLFVIDECHNHFSDKKSDPVIEWWLTYHGHLHQEIHLITQQMKLINPKYKGIAEYFFKAYSSSNQVSAKNFRYSQHVCGGYFAKDAKTKIFVPFREEVFNMYVSGKAQKRVNKLKKFYYIIPFGLFVLFLGFSQFSSLFASDVKIQDKNASIIASQATILNQTDVNTSKDAPSESLKIDYDNEVLIVFNCVNSSCYYKSVTLPISFLEFYVKAYPPKFYNIDSPNSNYSTYTLLVEKKLSELLVPEVKEKKGNKNAKAHNPINSMF